MKIRLDHPLWRRWAPAVARTLAEAYLRTCRLELAAAPEAQKLMASGGPTIYVMWHGQLIYTLYYFSLLYAVPAIVTSPSRDGEFIAEVARGWGYRVFQGSQDKGGLQALKQMAAHLRQGHSGGIIADGSRGPARVAQKGPVFLAREAQAPLIPLAVAASLKVTFNSWDRFELPLPFSRLAVLMGDPLWVPAGARGPALESLRRDLETRLNALCRQSGEIFPQKKF
jgi:hypothetical protein